MADLSPTIGRIAGIPIELNWFFILLLLFILFFSTLYYFLLWVLLFVCVLVHELTHSMVAKRNGVRVKKIVLYPFGGGSIIDFENVTPKLEMKISIVGPISSLLIAVAILPFYLLFPSGTIGNTLFLLVELNVFLGVFNLLPWLPLDGGRALRSYLQEKRSFLESTRIAVRASNVMTALFVIGNFAYFAFVPGYTFAQAEFIVLFDLVIALFIYSGAQSELQSAFIRESIKQLRVRDATSRNFTLVKPGTTTGQLYRQVLKTRRHVVLFRENGKIKQVSIPRLERLRSEHVPSTAKSMGIEIPQMDYRKPLFNAIERMRLEDANIVAAMDGHRLVGVVLLSHLESVVALYLQRKGLKSKES